MNLEESQSLDQVVCQRFSDQPWQRDQMAMRKTQLLRRALIDQALAGEKCWSLDLTDAPLEPFAVRPTQR